MTHRAIEAAARALNDLSEDQWLKCDIETKQFARAHVLATILAFLDAAKEPSPGMVKAVYDGPGIVKAVYDGLKLNIVATSVATRYWQTMLAALRAEVAGEGSE